MRNRSNINAELRETIASGEREMDRLEGEVKAKTLEIVEKDRLILQLEGEVKVLQAQVKDKERLTKQAQSEVGLWRKYAEGCEARIQLSKSDKPDVGFGHLLAPLAAGAAGALFGSYLGGKKVKDVP